MPKVSVIIPTYNRARYLGEAVDSVLGQTFKDSEIIVVDDGSTDNTREVLERYGSNIHCIYRNHKGRSEARNAGINAAKGEYIAFLDDDDLWLPYKLEKQVAFLDFHPHIGLVHAFIEVIDESGCLLPKATKNHKRLYIKSSKRGFAYKALSGLCIMFISSVIIRKKCLQAMKLFDPRVEVYEDWDFYLRFSLRYNIGIIPEPLVKYRAHKLQSTNDKLTEGRINTSLKHLAILAPLGNNIMYNHIRHNFFMHLASAYYIAGDIGNARKYIIAALRLRPLVLFRPDFVFRFLVILLLSGRTNGSPSQNLYPERIIPNETSGGPLAEHLKRYEFAGQFCQGKVVLDAACGVGYGSNYLAAAAQEVIGVDISKEAVAYAKEYYQRQNINFEIVDIHNLSFPDRYFDVVCSFETLEHLDSVHNFLAEVRRVLKEGGVFIVSTPQAKRTISNPKNPYHITEFSKDDFQSLLNKYFSNVEIFGQKRLQSALHYYAQKIDIFHFRAELPGLLRRKICHMLATRSWDEANLKDFVISKDGLKYAMELIAVCRSPRNNGL